MMRFTNRNFLILILVLQLVLISQTSAFKFLFWNDEKEKKNETAEVAAKKGEVPGVKREPAVSRGQSQEYEFDEDEDDEQMARDVLQTDTKIGQVNRISDKTRYDLDSIRKAAAVHERLAGKESANMFRKRGQKVTDNRVQGTGRRADNRRSLRERQREEIRSWSQYDEDYDEFDDNGSQYEADQEDEKENKDEFAASKLVDRLRNEKLLNQAPMTFVSTKPKEKRRASLPKPNLSFLNAKTTNKTSLFNGSIKKNWKKKLGGAYKATKKGLVEGAKMISEVPKYMEKGIDSINAFFQLDSRGKILSLIEETQGDAKFVRGEFSQFTLSWSPIMERGLNYLGDKDLDKVKWNEHDDLDWRKDALDSLAFGYEFMRLMIIWRENLLVAHEAFISWLEMTKESVVAESLEVDEKAILKIRATHNFMMLCSWQIIETSAKEARSKLNHLMEVFDDRPKNYESDYFRNIIVLQELYEPTIEEFEKERQQVIDSVIQSGVVVDLESADEFYKVFRSSLVTHELTGIDWEVPERLVDFMEMLKPQLSRNTLVYSKSFLMEIGLIE